MTLENDMPETVVLGKFYYAPGNEWYLAEVNSKTKYIHESMAEYILTSSVRSQLEAAEKMAWAIKHAKTMIKNSSVLDDALIDWKRVKGGK